MTRDQTIGLLKAIRAIFPQQSENQIAIDMWNRALANYQVAKVQRALEDYISSDVRWQPTPGQLIAMIARPKPTTWHTMTLDDRGHVRWQPELGGPVFDIPVEYDPHRDVYVDPVNGYEFAVVK